MSYTVSVVLSFPVSAVKAAEVLERWWKVKAERKAYMRGYRRGGPAKKKGAPGADRSVG